MPYAGIAAGGDTCMTRDEMQRLPILRAPSVFPMIRRLVWEDFLGRGPFDQNVESVDECGCVVDAW